MNRSTESLFPSFPQSSSGNPLPALLLDARLETAGMTGLEQSVLGRRLAMTLVRLPTAIATARFVSCFRVEEWL